MSVGAVSKFAEATKVSVERSKTEIERILQRYNASQFLTGWDQDLAFIGFTMHRRQVRFVLALPSREDDEFWITDTGRNRTESAAIKSWEQECRRKWRSLALMIKAKLEGVDSGIAIFEQEFLANIVIPGGSTFGQWAEPQISAAYETGELPSLLPCLASGDE